ncbi:tyrosine-type recombinase/integrase [Cytobacillus firmus]|uniref:tyrosine-type recombinase/integrase n=1 Tax=Cytobacillus firmus TaxID=1399 RepID=UPI00237B2D08|nr:site-specific integrase [Cytobacillus firmus]MDD9309749.1 tyrosine-type recombinase/integrase [Cytobacillus firmus]
MITNEHYHFEVYKPIREKLLYFIENELVGNAAETQRSYYYSLELFFEYLLNNFTDHFPHYTEKEVNQFIKSLGKKSPSYIHRIFNAIHNYSMFIGVPLNKKRIALPKQTDYKQIQPRSLSNERMDSIENRLYLEYIKQKEKNEQRKGSAFPNTGKVRDKLRNYILYRLMVQTSLRISEAISLDFVDIFLDGKREESRYLYIKGKGNKHRKVPIPKELKELLTFYIDFRKQYDEEIEFEKLYFKLLNKRLSGKEYEGILENLTEAEQKALDELNNKDNLNFGEILLSLDIQSNALRRYIENTFKQNTALFISNRGKRVSKDAMLKMFSKEGIRSHDLRHTAIKNLVDKGVPINRVQAISGHSSADMVLRYSKPTFEEIQMEMETNQKAFNRKL